MKKVTENNPNSHTGKGSGDFVGFAQHSVEKQILKRKNSKNHKLEQKIQLYDPPEPPDDVELSDVELRYFREYAASRSPVLEWTPFCIRTLVSLAQNDAMMEAEMAIFQGEPSLAPNGNGFLAPHPRIAVINKLASLSGRFKKLIQLDTTIAEARKLREREALAKQALEQEPKPEPEEKSKADVFTLLGGSKRK